jgi:hypothetical protein
MTGEEIAARARSQIGVRISGAGALRRAWARLCRLGGGGDLRGTRSGRLSAAWRIARDLAAELEQAGLERVAVPEIGDVLVLQAGPAQLHLAIVSSLGVVHADAGLRPGRRASRPGPVARASSLADEEQG